MILLRATLEPLEHGTTKSSYPHILRPFIHEASKVVHIVVAHFVYFDPLTALDNQPRVHFAALTPLIIRESPIFDLQLLFPPSLFLLAHYVAGRGAPIAKFQ